jgi:hypothetical protein
MVLATFPQVFPDMMPTVQIERHTFWDEKVWKRMADER